MINLLIGPPGGGKSYEAVVYHVLPSLNAGRKVITNLPLDLEKLRANGYDAHLVEIREKTKAVKPEVDWQQAESNFKKFGIAAKTSEWVDRAFSHAADYGDFWRHPETGAGPLYVVDECHLALPRGSTQIAVEEWFSLHRHESADVLLITQSYGKVSRSIVDLVQICYRVKKATAFGSANRYIRKVQDGVRGDVVNETIREYKKQYFGFYKSHTRGGGAELAAQDIVPIWQRWPFIGAAIFLSAAVAIFTFGGASMNPLKNGFKKAPEPVKVVETVNGVVVKEEDKAKADDKDPKPMEPEHPYSGREMHVVGSVSSKKGIRYHFAVSQNGQQVSSVDSNDLETLGYKIDKATPCAVKVTWDKWSHWVICDAPQIAVATSSAGVETGQRGGGTREAGGSPPQSVQKTERPARHPVDDQKLPETSPVHTADAIPAKNMAFNLDG